MSLLTEEYSTKTSKEQGKEVMTTPSVSLKPPKTISLTYIPPLSSHTQGVKSINATVMYLEPTPNPYPTIIHSLGPNCTSKQKSILGTTQTTPGPRTNKKDIAILQH